MKVYISADIEGVTGILNWNQCNHERPEYKEFSNQMSREVAAACMGANMAGAKEILVRDAHHLCSNIDLNILPENAMIVRGMSGHPFAMMQEIDSTFDVAMMIGYHSGSSFEDNPLCHTYSLNIFSFKLNGELVNEFLINTYIASYVGVPVVFLSGDVGICNYAKDVNPNMHTVATNRHFGSSTISIHPELSLKLIKEGVRSALTNDISSCFIQIPDEFEIEICFHDPAYAYKKSFYPGMEKISSTTLRFYSKDYYEVLRMMQFGL